MSKEPQQKNGPTHWQPMTNANTDGNAKGGNVPKPKPKNPTKLTTNKGTTNKDPNLNKENTNPTVAALQGKQVKFLDKQHVKCT